MQVHLYTAVLLGAVRTTRPTKLSEVYAVELASGVKPLWDGAADLPHRVLHLARVAARRLTPDPERVRIILLYVHLLANPPLSTQPLLSASLPEDGYWPSCLHMRAKSRPAHIREALSE